MVDDSCRDMRIREAEKGQGMTEAEAKEYLVRSRSNMILATVDTSGNPVMQPVWYYFDPNSLRLYMFTFRATAKASNMRRRDVIYFDVDDDRFPYRGVRGRGRAREVADKATALDIMGRILARYVRPGHPVNSMYLDYVEKGAAMIIEITPEYLTTWDAGKGNAESVKAYGDALLP